MRCYVRFSVLWICLFVLIVFFSSCTEYPDLPTDGVYVQQAINLSASRRFVAHGDYVYYSGRYVMKYNYLTGEGMRACSEPSHPANNCPLDSVWVFFSDFSTGVLYFAAEGVLDYKGYFYYASYDPVSGAVKILKEFSGNEANYDEIPSVDGGYLYYTHKKLKESGNASEPNDYIPYLCRMPLNGGEEEVLLVLDGMNLCTIWNGNAILFTTSDEQTYYSVDLSTKEETVLMNVQETGFLSFGVRGVLYDGKIYALATDGSIYQDKYIEIANFFLVSLDLKTGEVKQVVNEPITDFCLTEEGIYYTLLDPQHLYIPESSDETGYSLTYSPDLHVCNFDGTDDRVVYSNPGYDYAGYEILVVRGKLIGSFAAFSEETHTFEEAYLGAIDLKTGEITFFTSDESVKR